tara:strand:- start:14365 stop:14577 length:213 start_codon:yes stop_codon:yes gene_type:complete
MVVILPIFSKKVQWVNKRSRIYEIVSMLDMKRIILYGFFFILFSTTCYTKEPLRFAQIIDTPDQWEFAKD